MLPLTDMIRFQVGKYAEVEDKSLRPVQHQSLGGYFHHHRITACIRHLSEILLDQNGFRCGVVRMDVGIADNNLNGTDQTDLSACLL